jgi:N-acetylmuramoyl-L-alanine amidase
MLPYRHIKIFLINSCLALCLTILLYTHSVYAVTAMKANIATSENTTIFYLRLNQKPDGVKKFILNNPDRIVLDIQHLEWHINDKIPSHGVIKRIRFGKNNDNGRIVFDVTQKITTTNIDISPHSSVSGSYLLKLTLYHSKNAFDLNTILKNQTQKNLSQATNTKSEHAATSTKENFYSKHQFKSIKRRSPNDIIITIDAGHGGNDPGATSLSGFKEKNIVLDFSKELANSINRQNGMQAILTRDNDFFIPLDERPMIASHYKSDVFISIHADALKDKNFSGSTVYTLSDTASDEIAAQIAESENQSDIIAGVNLTNQNPEVTDILIDFMRRETDIASYELAENLVQKLQKSTSMVASPHRKAGFRVLKSPNIPSVLIELGYLTSIDDERRLTNPEKRRTMINNMIFAIKNWHHQRQLSGH